MKLTLIRHGEMDGEPFVCPQQPVHGCLTEDIGVPQAKATAQALKNEKFDIAYSSPFGRALQTAEIVLEGRGLQIKIMPFMHEWMPHEKYRNLPDEEWEDLMREHSAVYAEDNWTSEIGEGRLDMYTRIVPPFLKEMGKIGIHARYGGYVPDEYAKDLSVVIFAHGGSLSVLVSFLLGLRLFPVSGFWFMHTGVAKIHFTEQNGVYYPQLVIPSLHNIERN